jgi:tripartite-type tricarboxylate transporter receptor subunit TctC
MIRHSLIWCGLAAALAVSAPARGQDYPNRQIMILVGIAAGGITDVTTRQYAAVLSKNMDQNIIIENRPVAGGAVAAAAVQSAAPDGYTLLSVVGSQFCSVPAMGFAPYDPVKGFTPISLTFRLPTLLVVPMDSPAKTVAELLAWGKTKPGGLLLGSPGAGTPGHLLAAKIALATHTPIQYIHYRGARTPELIAKLTENGNIVASSTPQEMSKFVADEAKDMEQLIKTLGLKVY